VGTCFGKFSKSKKFRLHITALDYLAAYAKYKIWIKPNGVMPFLYGNNVLKAHLGRITENTPQYVGVVFYSMNDMPLGFGRSALSTADCRKIDPTAVIAFHQSDVGEYLREEDSLFVKQATASKQRQSGSLLSTELTNQTETKTNSKKFKKKKRKKTMDNIPTPQLNVVSKKKQKRKKDNVPLSDLTATADVF